MEKEAWLELSNDESSKVWSMVYDRLLFRSKHKDFNLVFREPSPSITYSVKGIWGDSFEALDADLEEKAQRIFKDVTPSEDFLYALEIQHPSYRYFPHRVRLPGDCDIWEIAPLPYGDFCMFLEPSLRFGWLGHPWAATICLFGQPLLAAMKRHRPRGFRNPIRQKEEWI